MTAVRDIPRSARWTVPLSLLGLGLAVPFSAPDGTGMQWDLTVDDVTARLAVLAV